MRWMRHLFARPAASHFPGATLKRIAEAIARGERLHRGQVCFAVEPALGLRALLRGRDARDRAQQLFARLRVWDTADNNGVLIYLLLADRRIEIVADRAASGPDFDARWAAICARLVEQLRAGRFEPAAIEAVDAAAALMTEHFPRGAAQAVDNAIPDEPILVDAAPD